ncbi:hypothetical protein [Dasania marina]|uniref:hypothetical protein n=1 Tax=Dasania marina TaxID=471499 RepID=UPI0003685E09|nr:hypothetical protein [Dasania marina]
MENNTALGMLGVCATPPPKLGLAPNKTEAQMRDHLAYELVTQYPADTVARWLADERRNSARFAVDMAARIDEQQKLLTANNYCRDYSRAEIAMWLDSLPTIQERDQWRERLNRARLDAPKRQVLCQTLKQQTQTS